MAGSLPGGALNALGTAVIPETMARLQMPALIDQAKREQQVGNIQAGRLLGGADAEIGTPQTKSYQVNGRTIGQDNPSTVQPLFSTAKRLALFSQAMPEQAKAFQAQRLQNSIAPQLPSKDDFIGTPGEGGVFNWRKGTMVTGTTIPKERDADGQWAIRANDGKPQFVSKKNLLESNGAFLPVPTGMRVMADGQGGFQITTGGMDPIDMTNPTKTKLEDTILTGRDALSRMTSIEERFKPEYQQLGTRWANTFANLKDKAGIQLDAATRAQLEDFSAYRRDASANLNQTIKDITGATVSEQEAPRLMSQIPNAGAGLFDGDGPTEFQAKVKGTKDSIKSAIARAEYARKNGLTKQQQFAIPLASMPQMIDERGNEYRDQLERANPEASDEQINEMVKARLRQEFGL